MKNNLVINAMIPARMGSTRLKQKNLALLDGKPLIWYVINAAKGSSFFSDISVNSEHENFKIVAERYGVNFYKRSSELGGSSVKSDDVVYDYMLRKPGDVTVWVNPTSPLQTSEEIDNVLTYFLEEQLDSLITVRDENVHCVSAGKPLNFDFEDVFAQTQDLIPVGRFVYSIMAWKNSSFIAEYETRKSAFFCGKVGFYSVGRESSLIVKTQEDLNLIASIIAGRKWLDGKELEYDELAII